MPREQRDRKTFQKERAARTKSRKWHINEIVGNLMLFVLN